MNDRLPRPYRGAAWLALLVLLAPAGPAGAGGGVILSEDTCIMTIGFYEAHFTAYQPDTRGDEQFCEDLPDTGTTLFVLDYLHASLREVPVDFRIIRNVTGKGEFARIGDIEALDDIARHTVFYQPPRIKSDGTYTVEHAFAEPGDYIGIVTAGHPSNDNIYMSVFPFAVGKTDVPWGWLVFAAALLAGGGFVLNMRRIGAGGAAS
ncbi:MAG: hypothetical protein U5K76_10695 [Woeseiaceae bacterium]|nr:hypothetical protein [Woeseiaceae bacterium]